MFIKEFAELLNISNLETVKEGSSDFKKETLYGFSYNLEREKILVLDTVKVEDVLSGNNTFLVRETFFEAMKERGIFEENDDIKKLSQEVLVSFILFHEYGHYLHHKEERKIITEEEMKVGASEGTAEDIGQKALDRIEFAKELLRDNIMDMIGDKVDEEKYLSGIENLIAKIEQGSYQGSKRELKDRMKVIGDYLKTTFKDIYDEVGDELYEATQNFVEEVQEQFKEALYEYRFIPEEYDADNYAGERVKELIKLGKIA